MTQEVIYSCLCGATKTIINNPERSGNQTYEFPKTVICGYRGCFKVARPISK